MANPTNTIEIDKSLAATLAEVVSDGTRADVIDTTKVDEAGKEAAATDQFNCAAQLALNCYDDAYKRTVELWYQHRKVWRADNLAALQAYGSADNLSAFDLGFEQATATLYYCTAVTGSSTSTWALAVPPTPTGPQDVYEIDWAAEPSSGPLSDGAHVLSDGKAITIKNSANGSLEIVNGVGLVITCTAGAIRILGSGIAAGSTAPYIHVPLVDLSDECRRYMSPIEIWSHVSAYTLEVSNHSILSGVAQPAGPYSAITFASALIRSGADIRGGGRRGSTVGIGVVDIGDHDVLIWRSQMDETFDVFSGEYAAGWPARDALRADTAYGDTAAFSTTGMFRHEFAELILGVETRSSSAGADPSATFARTRILIG